MDDWLIDCVVFYTVSKKNSAMQRRSNKDEALSKRRAISQTGWKIMILMLICAYDIEFFL